VITVVIVLEQHCVWNGSLLTERHVMAKTAVAKVEESLMIPDGFSEIGPLTTPDQLRLPYVQFVAAKARNYGQLLRKFPTLREGEPVLILPTPLDPILLNPFTYFLLDGTEFWGLYDQQSQLLAASRTQRETSAEEAAKKQEWKQTYESVVLVILDNQIMPAQVRFVRTKCPAVQSAVRTRQEVEDEELWAAHGPDYKRTLRISQKWARFVTCAIWAEKLNRSTNRMYQTMEAQSHPTRDAEAELVNDFFYGKNHEDNIAAVNAVKAGYKRRMEFVEKQMI